MKPHVTCVCLTADRQQFTDRAVRCFLSQTYENKSLLIFDTGTEPYGPSNPEALIGERAATFYLPGLKSTIGELRNLANMHVESELIAHWDSDDWSNPYRLASQVSAITLPGLEVVGYYNLLFWDYERKETWFYDHQVNNSERYCLGTSLLYRRDSWQKRRFNLTSSGEDLDFLRGRKVLASHSYHMFHCSPMIVGAIHAGNQPTSGYALATRLDKSTQEWKRVPSYDAEVGKIMGLECSGAKPL